jgi:hypothetical protein
MRVFLLALVMGSSVVVGQDAVKTLPDNYSIQFENEYVRVTRVHYPAKVQLPAHTHTSLPTAYVYLNDSGPVAFKHVGLEYGAVTRPPTVARSYRLFRGLEEIHEVENLGTTPSDFLRVEFKTDPGPDPRTLRGKFLPPKARTEAQMVEFENVQLRITRVTAASSLRLPASARPSVLVSLGPARLGAVTWVGAGHEPLGASGSADEMLRFELKTEVRPTR